MPQQIDVGFAEIRDKAPPGGRLKHSNQPVIASPRVPRDATRFPFFQKNEIGRAASTDRLPASHPAATTSSAGISARTVCMFSSYRIDGS